VADLVAYAKRDSDHRSGDGRPQCDSDCNQQLALSLAVKGFVNESDEHRIRSFDDLPSVKKPKTNH
jgi:hypothetical protein